jgi:Protein of unknown function (DUF3347)
MKLNEVVGILEIVLPALILLIGIIRLFSKNRNGSNAFIMFIAVLLLLIGIARYFFFPDSGGSKNSGPKPLPMAVSKHSDLFNNSVSSVLNAYYKLTEGFVNWDTVAVNKYGIEIKTALDSLKIEELKVDTTGIYESALDPLANARTEAANILSNPSIDVKRTSFSSLSENLRLLFIVVKYDREKMYWQECPMAFGDDKPGNWLSRTKDVRNPYLGTKHPEYKDGMLKCGGPIDTINFIPVDTTIKAK